MLASQGVVGAELGEDRDHDPPQEVAALGVVGLADHGLQALECALQIALVPRGERLSEGARSVVLMG